MNQSIASRKTLVLAREERPLFGLTLDQFAMKAANEHGLLEAVNDFMVCSEESCRAIKDFRKEVGFLWINAETNSSAVVLYIGIEHEGHIQLRTITRANTEEMFTARLLVVGIDGLGETEVESTSLIERRARVEIKFNPHQEGDTEVLSRSLLFSTGGTYEIWVGFNTMQCENLRRANRLRLG